VSIQRECDVLVLGGGFVGSVCAAISARMGHSTVLVDVAEHPRVSIGESTTPEWNASMYFLGCRYGIPELVDLASYPRIKARRLPIAVWPKESFYFCAHPSDGQRGFGELMHQSTPIPIGPDFHVFRADYDFYLFSLAARLGAVTFAGVSEMEIDLDARPSVHFRSHDGAVSVRTRLVVDATGPAAFLARKLGLFESDPPRLGLRSRAVYNHFVGVKGVDEVAGSGRPRMPFPRDNATVHFMQEGGWSWIIPFDSGVTSVGGLFEQRGDKTGDGLGVDDFESRIAEHPLLSRMMASARPVRRWRTTPRLQWSSSAVAGDSWLMTASASGFSDPFLSVGGPLALYSVGRLVDALDSYLAGQRPASEVFAAIVSKGPVELEYACRLQEIFYRSFGNFALFERAHELYRLALMSGGVGLGAQDPPWRQGYWGTHRPEIRAAIDATAQAMNAGDARGGDVDLARRIDEIIAKHDWLDFVTSKANLPRGGEHVYLASFHLMSWLGRVNRTRFTREARTLSLRAAALRHRLRASAVALGLWPGAHAYPGRLRMLLRHLAALVSRSSGSPAAREVVTPEQAESTSSQECRD